MKNRILITKEYLEQEYIRNKRSSCGIATELGISHKTILNRLKEFGITWRNARGPKIGDLIGKQFGSYVVIGPAQKNASKNKTRWLCRCICGKENILNTQSITQGKTKSCKKCARFTGIEELSGTYLKIIKSRALREDRIFNLDLPVLWELYLKQDKKCALSGIEIKLERSYSRNCKTQTASLDRIDSNKGYTLDNVQWVYKDLNIIKSNTPNDEFINWCKLIAKQNE